MKQVSFNKEKEDELADPILHRQHQKPQKQLYAKARPKYQWKLKMVVSLSPMAYLMFSFLLNFEDR